MKIVLLTPELFRSEGGIARIMRVYLKALCEICGPAGRVTSLALNDDAGQAARLEHYTNDHLVRHIGADRHKVQFVMRAIQMGQDADWIVCGHIGQLIAARLAKVFNPALRYAVVAHGIEVWRPYRLLERWALHGAQRILCVSAYTRRQMLRFAPALDPSKLLVVANTLDPNLEDTGALMPETNHAPTILSVGRLVRSDAYKGFDCLIEAMPIVKRQLPTAQLRLVGTGDDLERLRSLAAQFEVSAAVTFVGSLTDDQLKLEYANCAIFALPSRREGFGLVYLEAMIRGKSCIGARAGGTPEVITSQTGRLVEYGDIPSLASAMLDLLRHPCDSKKVRRHAQSFVYPHFRKCLASVLTAA